MPSTFKEFLKTHCEASAIEQASLIQELWSGYGSITRYALSGARYNSVVVKHIAPEVSSGHPRGWNTQTSHQRKLKSYAIESYWYEHWSSECDETSKVPQLLGRWSKGVEQWLILEDLDPQFPIRKTEVNLQDVKICLRWLANFHAQFLNRAPQGLWEVGTYWHLATRPDELEAMEHLELKAKAVDIDQMLNSATFKTIVHGDAKLANFCFSEDGKAVAAVDFQYVGGGCGIKDVAYFLGSCLTGADCEYYEEPLLTFYFSEMEMALKRKEILLDFEALEAEWRLLYPVACTDFTRFLMGWMPGHHKLNSYTLDLMEAVLERFKAS